MGTENIVISVSDKGTLIVKRNIESIGKSAQKSTTSVQFLKRALKKKKRRVATKPSRASKAKRLDAKKKQGQKKTERLKNRKGTQD